MTKNEKLSSFTIIPTNILVEISKYLDTRNKAKMLFLNKAMSISLPFKTEKFIFTNSTEINIKQSNSAKIANITIYLITQEAYKDDQLFMIDISYGSERLGLVPLLYRNSILSVNCNEEKYKSVISALNSYSTQHLKLKVIPMSKQAYHAKLNKLIFIINYL